MNKPDVQYENAFVQSGINIALNIGKGYLISLLLLFFLACAITYTSLSENYVGGIISAITVIGIIIASAGVTKKKRTKGWLHGAFTGFIYTAVIYILSITFLSEVGVQNSAILPLFIGILCGALGGIIGINLKKK